MIRSDNYNVSPSSFQGGFFLPFEFAEQSRV